MNNKQLVEYLNKDVPTLKKDVALRMMFALLFIVAFVWQMVLLLQMPESSSLLNIVLTALVLIFCAMYAFTSIMYAINSLKTVQTIKHKGKSINNARFVYNIEKRSFVHLYSFITSMLAILALMFLVSALTYSVFSYVYYKTLSTYIPLIIMFVTWCFNSAYHLKNEIFISQNVNRFNSMFY